jgi:hypothetical protein
MPDLHSLHRGNGHDRRADAARRACDPTTRASRVRREGLGNDLADPAERVARAFDVVDERDHALLGVASSVRNGEASDVRLMSGGHRIGSHGVDSAEVHEMAADANLELAREIACTRRRRDARRGLARRCALENVARVVTIVLEQAGEIGVAGAGRVTARFLGNGRRAAGGGRQPLRRE